MGLKSERGIRVLKGLANSLALDHLPDPNEPLLLYAAISEQTMNATLVVKREKEKIQYVM